MRNQGLQIAVVVFVLLSVIATGMAVLTTAGVRELRIQAAAERRTAQAAQANFEAVLQELDVVKGFIGLSASPETNLMPDLATVERRYRADLQKYGRRLQAVQDEAATPAGYSQTLDAVLTVLEQRHRQLSAANEEIVLLRTQKAAIAAAYEKQTDQFRKHADAADLARADAVSRLREVENRRQIAEKRLVDELARFNAEMQSLQLEMQTRLEDRQRIIDEQKATIAFKDKVIDDLQPNPFVDRFDGRVTRVDAATRTAWINVGRNDQLRPGVRFGVLAQDIPAGGVARPKAQLDVVRILAEHLAECRIANDELADPILIDDKIYTALWSPGRRTHFAFVGHIDLDGDGGHDLPRIRALVDDAAGQIDCVAHVTGELEGALSTETRYLIVGAMPVDASGKEVYHKVLEQAERYGVQRISTAVFTDRIGYPSRGLRAVSTGYEPAGRSPRLFDVPDGGPRISTGSVSDLFRKRRPPAAGEGSAY
jgi:hypothetical protein